MRRSIATVLLITLAFTGCYKWTATDGLPRHLEEQEQTIRLSFSDSSQVELRAARVQGDSLLGKVPTTLAGRSAYRQVGYELALENVERIEVRREDSTLQWVVLGVVGGLGLGMLVACVDPDEELVC